MILWERGQLGLDDPVSNYLPPNLPVLASIDTLRTDTSFTRRFLHFRNDGSSPDDAYLWRLIW